MNSKEVGHDYIMYLFADAEVVPIGFGEVVRHRDTREWRITYGCVRARGKQGRFGIKKGLLAPRSYKAVSSDDSGGKAVSLKGRMMREWDD